MRKDLEAKKISLKDLRFVLVGIINSLEAENPREITHRIICTFLDQQVDQVEKKTQPSPDDFVLKNLRLGKIYFYLGKIECQFSKKDPEREIKDLVNEIINRCIDDELAVFQ